MKYELFVTGRQIRIVDKNSGESIARIGENMKADDKSYFLGLARAVHEFLERYAESSRICRPHTVSNDYNDLPIPPPIDILR